MDRTTLCTWGLAILVGLVFVWLLPAAGQREDEIILVGTIVAVDWDVEGNVLAVAVKTEDQGSIAVDINQKCVQLLSAEGHQVEIVGSVFDEADASTYVEVHSFRILPSSVSHQG